MLFPTRPRRRSSALVGALLIAGSTVVGIGAPATAAHVEKTPVEQMARHTEPPRTDASDSSVTFTKGTRVEFHNTTDYSVRIGKDQVHPGQSLKLSGNNSDGDDVSADISDMHGNRVQFYGHNPWRKEAYLQFDGQKVHNNAYVKQGGMNFYVQFNGTGDDYKEWRVDINRAHQYAHEFIQNTDKWDGVKGIVTNKTQRHVSIKMGGTAMELKPGQSLLYYDAQGIRYGWKSTRMELFVGSTSVAHIEAGDHDAFMPTVWVSDRWPSQESDAKGFVAYSEGESHSHDRQEGIRVQVERHKDGRLADTVECFATKDWAWFDFTIKDA